MAKGARKVIGRIIATIVILGLFTAGVLAYLNRQEISDFFAAQRFDPSPEITELTENMHLTSAGERIFFASSPTLDASQNFNTQCAEVEHGDDSNVLGCFTNGLIHLFKVTDPRLNGIVEVTATHELMHAVYSRISTDARASLSQKLRAAYAELIKTNPDLETRMSVYSDLSDQGFANELHSILATEVRDLPDWLEEHYATWIADRSAVVDQFDAYRGVFSQIQSRVNELRSSLEALRDDIERRSKEYDAAVEAFNADVAEFNRRNANYEFSDDPAQFERLRDGLQARSAALQGDLIDLQTDIARHEAMRLELEELGATSAELNERLDSQLAPAPTS